MTKNAINATSPIGIASGGTNTSSMTTSFGTAYFDGTEVAVTGAGTSGQVLISNGTSAPTFQTLVGGTDAWTLIKTQNVSAVSAITFTGLSSSYNTYMLTYGLASLSTPANSLYVEISSNNGSSYTSSGYLSGNWYTLYTTTTLSARSTTTCFVIAGGTGTKSGTVYLTGFGWTGGYPSCTFENLTNTTSGAMWLFGAGSLTTVTVAYNGFKVYTSSGTITGIFSLYGLAK
jgi:hypothetical protein